MYNGAVRKQESEEGITGEDGPTDDYRGQGDEWKTKDTGSFDAI